jgi:hypothetical protein
MPNEGFSPHWWCAARPRRRGRRTLTGPRRPRPQARNCAAACASRSIAAQSRRHASAAGVSHEPPTQATFGDGQVVACIAGIDAAGGAETHVRQRTVQGAQRRNAACDAAGKNFW